MLYQMWRFTKRNRGGIGVETMATLLLLLLLGMSIFSLAVSSTSAYSRLYEGDSLQSRLRVALSFIHMKIRQNDCAGAVSIEQHPVTLKPALVIREEYEEVYKTWIYQDGGKLREALMPEGEPPSNDLSFEIADVDGFELVMTRNVMDFSVWIDTADGRMRLDSRVLLRSDN